MIGYQGYVRWTRHPVIVTIGDNRDYIRASYILIIPLLQGGGVLLSDRLSGTCTPRSPVTYIYIYIYIYIYMR